MMKALVLKSVGEWPHLQLRDVAVPTPGANDVLLRVTACGICYHDVAVVDGTLRRGVKPDVILGHEVSGVVSAVGDAVASVKTGDRVVAPLPHSAERAFAASQGMSTAA